MKKTVIIVDDHPIVRKGFAQIINQEKDLEVIGECGDLTSAEKMIYDKQPSLVLLDLSLGKRSGIELLKNLAYRKIDTRVLVISLYSEKVYAERVLQAGALGFIMKTAPTEELLLAVRTVIKGGVYISGTMEKELIHKYIGKKHLETSLPEEKLSDREMEIFDLLGDGCTTKDISDSLNIGRKTVETHLSHIKNKLQLESINKLIQYAVEWKMSIST